MPSWYIKAAIQGSLSSLPQPQKANMLFQKFLGRGTFNLSDTFFEYKAAICRSHIEHYQSVYPNKLPGHVLELGTGWHPIVPLGLALCGIEKITSVDVTSLLSPALVKDTLDTFLRYSEEGWLGSLLPIQPERLSKLHEARKLIAEGDVSESLKLVGVESLIIDVNDLPNGSPPFDFVVSNNTLEHIPREMLNRIFESFQRLASKQAVMSHLVDMSDHYSHFDRTLSPYHFLRFSTANWRLFNNKLHYQNRLRASEYLEIHQQTGFKVIHAECKTGTAEQIEAIILAPEFAHLTGDDLTATHIWIVSVRS